MPKGLYRDKTGWVVVESAGNQSAMPRNAYETKGYEPRYDLLPTEAQHQARLGKSTSLFAKHVAGERRA